jgi:hypothetical protein
MGAFGTLLEDRPMIRAIALAAILSLAATGAMAQKLDANGKCHAADGKFAKAEVCKGGAKADAGPYKLDKKGNCHDAKGKMAKKTMCPAAAATTAAATPAKK